MKIWTYFFFYRCRVSSLISRSLTIVSWFLCSVRDRVLYSFCCMWISSFPSTICWRGFLFSIAYFWPLCLVWENCIYLGLCPCPLFCTNDLPIYFGTNTMPFLLLLICNRVEDLVLRYPCFILSTEDCFSYSGFFILPDEFHNCLLYFCKVHHWDFNWNCIESV